MALLARTRTKAVVDPGAFLDNTAAEYLAALVAAGCLVSLFRTSDGGALGCQVTLDGETEKEYHRLPEELHEWLAEVVQAVTEHPPPAPSTKRPRRAA